MAIDLLLGTSNIGPELPTTPGHTHTTAAGIKSLLDCWKSLGGKRLDSAAVYGQTAEYGPHGSEKRIRETTDGSFIVDTKALGLGEPGSHSAAAIRKSIEDSLNDLGVPKVNIFYLHSPDRSTPFLESLQALDELYKEGKFERLGLSNFKAEEVEEFCELSRQHTLIKPSAYQGNYSALSRRGEQILFPVLRREGISFLAYSPLAMGMLSGGAQKESVEAARTLPPGSRFHPDSRKAAIFQGIWFRPEIFEAVKLLNKIAAESDLTPTELSLRWLSNHSQLQPQYGDGIILGASSNQQLEETVKALEGGPLSDAAVEGFEEMWRLCAEVSPKYCN